MAKGNELLITAKCDGTTL